MSVHIFFDDDYILGPDGPVECVLVARPAKDRLSLNGPHQIRRRSQSMVIL